MAACPLDWYRLSDVEINVYVNNCIVSPSTTLILDPTVTHLVKNASQDEELTALCGPIQNYEYLLAPLNDRANDTKEGGGHWSLLIVNLKLTLLYHIDSHRPQNCTHAQQLAKRLIGSSTSCNVQEIVCKQQKFDVECGVHVLNSIRVACHLISNGQSLYETREFENDFSVQEIYDVINVIKICHNNDNSESVISDKVGGDNNTVPSVEMSKPENLAAENLGDEKKSPMESNSTRAKPMIGRRNTSITPFKSLPIPVKSFAAYRRAYSRLFKNMQKLRDEKQKQKEREGKKENEEKQEKEKRQEKELKKKKIRRAVKKNR